MSSSSPTPSLPETRFEPGLGCGEYEVYLTSRGGKNLISDLPWTALSWERVLDDTSSARIDGVYPSNDTAPCDLALASARAWQHEVAIYRDGELVWVGPLVKPTFTPDAFSFDARDLSAWWDHRFIHNDVIYDTATDASTVFTTLVEDAMSVDNSPGLVISTTPSGTLITVTILASQYQIAGQPIRDVTNTAIDWTMYQRKLLAGGATVPTGPLLLLFDDHFQTQPTPNLDGVQQVNSWAVLGSGGGSGGATVIGLASDSAAASRDGVLEAPVTIDTLLDNDAATAAAQTRLDLTKLVTLIEDAILSEAAPVKMSDLIPGALVPLDLRLTVPQILGTYRIQKVAVSAAADGTENVTLTLQPRGTD